MTDRAFHALSTDAALEELDTSAEGLSEAEVRRRLEEYGPNEIEKSKRISKIVPGDIILISTGDRAPADARLLTAANLQVDESMLTGESMGVTENTEAMEKEFADELRKLVQARNKGSD